MIEGSDDGQLSGLVRQRLLVAGGQAAGLELPVYSGPGSDWPVLSDLIMANDSAWTLSIASVLFSLGTIAHLGCSASNSSLCQRRCNAATWRLWLRIQQK